MQPDFTVSVVIPSYNASRTIVRCLKTLHEQTCAPLEIILVDSSSDDTIAVVLRDYPEVKVIHLPSLTFPGPARNMGARIARGDILAFIDSDCMADSTWIERIIALHAQGYRIVGGAIEVGDPDNAFAWAGHMMEFRDFIPAGPARPMGHIPSCNITYRRDLFEEVGGFPENYYPQEDFLLNHLLNLQKVTILFDPDLRIRHFCRDTLRDFISHQHRIGRVTRAALKKISQPGSQIARQTWLAWLAAPLLGAVKYVRTTLIFLKRFPEVALRKPAILPLLLIGSVWWARGFAASVITGLSGIRGWQDPEEPIFSKISSASTTAKE